MTDGWMHDTVGERQLHVAGSGGVLGLGVWDHMALLQGIFPLMFWKLVYQYPTA